MKNLVEEVKDMVSDMIEFMSMPFAGTICWAMPIMLIIMLTIGDPAKSSLLLKIVFMTEFMSIIIFQELNSFGIWKDYYKFSYDDPRELVIRQQAYRQTAIIVIALAIFATINILIRRG